MKYVISIVVSLLVGLGFGYPAFHNGATPQPVGGLYNTNKTQFVNGFTAGTTEQFSVSSAGALTTSGGITNTGAESALKYNTSAVGSSSSSPAALGSAAAGHFIVAPGATTAQASTTAVSANSTIIVGLETTTPIAGTTCNSTINASSTPIITSKTAGNGFLMTISATPVTNPFCYSYLITN